MAVQLGLLLHVSVIIAGAAQVAIIGVWYPANGVPCDVTESVHRLPVFTYSTKSPYRFSAIVSNETELGTCKAVTLYGLFRHGTRYPQVKHIRGFNMLFQSLCQKLEGFRSGGGDSDSGTLNRSLLTLLCGWKSQLNEEDDSQLSHHGSREMFCLAKRLVQRYPSLLGKEYCSSTYAFRSTQKSRAVESALSFAHGLFEGRGPLNGYQPITLEMSPPHSDTLLRFFDHCPLYMSMKEKGEHTEEFEKSLHVNEVVARVQATIDPEHLVWNLTTSEVLRAYTLCVSEHALFGNSIWCQLFSHLDVAAFEYLADLKLYWTKGHGRDINWKSATPLAEDMLEHLKQGQGSQATRPRGATFRFAHAETLLPFVAFWGLMNDSKPLRHDNYLEMLDRRFRGSHITPYSGNLVCVLYDCGSDAAGGEQFRVRLLLNEGPVTPPFCLKPDSFGMCSFSEFVGHFREQTGGRNFSDICSLPTSYD